MQRWFTLVWMFSLFSCTTSKEELSVLVEGSFKPIQTLSQNFTQNSVLIAYDPECPICLLYKNPMDSLSKVYTEFDWKVVVPDGADTLLTKSKFFEDRKITIYYDHNNVFLKKIGTTTTPQAFVFDLNNELIYSGKIDNRAKALGVKNLNTDSFYLAESLLANRNGTKPTIQKTEPIGCFIQ